MAGDGAGILVGAVLGGLWRLAPAAHLALEYALGFALGWTIFQALFTRRMSGSDARALASTVIPEWLSVNALMGGMVAAMGIAMRTVPRVDDPSRPAFWFVMSMSLTAGFAVGYPVNAWLVSRHLKHGMMTVRRPEPKSRPESAIEAHGARAHGSGDAARAPGASRIAIVGMSAATVLTFVAGLVIMFLVGM